MSLKIYNTQAKRKEAFVPLIPGKVGLYACGITAYDACHVGHARSAVVFDVITRYLRYAGYDVTYVKNFTDVDDKIIEKAKSLGTTIDVIADRYIAEHDRDMDALGVSRPTVAPRATQHIPGMIRLIETLLQKDLAYVMDGDVYFAVGRFAAYGKLSGRVAEDMMAGARVDVNDRKRNPLDFALWKASKAGEPWWESPWGNGRPGWHIECSVMSSVYLGDTFDIHGGGEDLIFPHHENEIAQSEGATGKTLARYWMHNGFVRVNNEKMSKSLGNFFTLADLLALYDPEVLRLFLLQSHYRSPVDFSDASLNEARGGMDRLYATLQLLDDVLAQGGNPAGEISPSERGQEMKTILKGLPDRFCEAMDDDFNTARALGVIFEAVRQLNGYLADQKKGFAPEALMLAGMAREKLTMLGGVLGLMQTPPEVYAEKDRDREARKRGIASEDVERLIAMRSDARTQKDWKGADEIRQKLLGMGIVLKDGPEKTDWRFA